MRKDAGQSPSLIHDASLPVRYEGLGETKWKCDYSRSCCEPPLEISGKRHCETVDKRIDQTGDDWYPGYSRALASRGSMSVGVNMDI